jgi:Peroxidase
MNAPVGSRTMKALPFVTVLYHLCIMSSLFVGAFIPASFRRVATQLEARPDDSMNRRLFGKSLLTGISSGLILQMPNSAYGEVFFDPAQYGDQELRVGAVDSVRESVRRAILQNPKLAPSFYQLALLDGLSYNAKTKAFGPDGKVVVSVLTSKQTDPYTTNLQKACLALIEAEKALRKKTAISLADAVAIAGAEAIESIGGPVLPVQLGRADTPKDGVLPPIPIDLFSGSRPIAQVTSAFANAGLTEREMTALLSGLLTLERVEKTRSLDDWKQSTRPKFREAGKMGRMSEFKPLTDEDIAQAELEADADFVSGDDDWYIADSFGTRDDRFGQRLGKDEISEKNFNKYLKELQELYKKGNKGALSSSTQDDENGWIAELLLDPKLPTVQTWWTKYAGTNLAYIKDLTVAYNSVTQLGAVYTGGKYENLLKNKPRRSLNDDDLNLF